MVMALVRRLSPLGVCVVMSAVALFIVGFFPGFAGPGYPSTIAAGLCLPSLCAVCCALNTIKTRTRFSLAFALVVSALYAAAIVGAGLVAILVHGVRVGFCDPVLDLTVFFIGPAFGTLMGGVWGWVVGQLVGEGKSQFRQGGCAALGAVAGPALGVVVSVVRFFTSPMVFAYDPFVGFFSGTLYDTEVSDQLGRLVTYRVGSLATLVAVACFCLFVYRNSHGKLRLRRFPYPRVPELSATASSIWVTRFVPVAVLSVGVVAAAASITVTVSGSRLGHWQTSTTIASALGARIENEFCEVVYPRTLDRAAASLLLRDCTTQAQAVARFFEMSSPPVVRVFMFQSREQKRMLTGAGGTSIAKPWRAEVYVQMRDYPHPILAHEIAHVYAGTFARGPFKIAGSFGGWFPDPGLIEGIAVAAAPDDDVLTPEQWSSAMQRLGVLPRLEQIFSVGFLAQNSSTAYTAAGAFVQWIGKNYGMQVVREWYGGVALQKLAGQSLASLEKTWHQQLATVQIPTQALAVAKARFDRPGVLLRRCPYAVDRLTRDAQRRAVDGDCGGAQALFARSLELDPQFARAKLGQALCAARNDGIDAAVDAWKQLAAQADMPEPFRWQALHALADLYLAVGEFAEASRVYRDLQQKLLDDDELRNIEVKLWAAQNPGASEAVRALLAPDPVRGGTPALTFALLGQNIASGPSSGLSAYLLGRAMVNSANWQQALTWLSVARASQQLSPSVLREALRLETIVACALQDREKANESWQAWKRQPGVLPVRVEVLARQLGPCVLWDEGASGVDSD